MKHPEQDLEPKSMRNYSRMKNQVTVSINQPLKFEKKDYGSFYLSGSWSDYWASGQNRSNYSIGYSNSASGAATVSVPSVHGMKTATLTIAFISVSPFLLKNYLALNNGLQVSRVLILK